MIATQDIVDEIVYLSLYDIRYQQIPEQIKLSLYTFICNKLNTFSQIEGKNLTSPYVKTYGNSNLSPGLGYSIIDTTLGNTVSGNWTVDNVTFNYANINYPLTYKDNETFHSEVSITNISEFPVYWSWNLATRSIWIYPPPIISGQFIVLARPLLPKISVALVGDDYIFTPANIDLPTEENFLEYAKFYVAKKVCTYSNAVFSEDKTKEMEVLKRQLTDNRVPNCTFNTLPSQLTKGKSNKTLIFPYFYFLSGGKY